MAVIAVLAAIAIAVLGWFVADVWALPIALLLGGALVFAVLSPQPLEIGSDGLAFAGRRKSFISFAELDAIEETAEATLLRCASGQVLRLVSARGARIDAAALNRLRSLVLRHWREAQPLLAFPPREGRPVAIWIESIRTTEAGSCREALLATVEDPALSALVRAVAALLLRNGFSHDERVRVDTAARATVELSLKRALVLVAGTSSTETEVLSALERLAPDHVKGSVFQRLRGELQALVSPHLSRLLSSCEQGLLFTRRVVDEIALMPSTTDALRRLLSNRTL